MPIFKLSWPLPELTDVVDTIIKQPYPEFNPVCVRIAPTTARVAGDTAVSTGASAVTVTVDAAVETPPQRTVTW